MNDITLKQVFAAAGTGAPAASLSSVLQVQTTNSLVATIKGSNMPEDASSWQTLGTATGYVPTAIACNFAWIRVDADKAGTVSIAAVDSGGAAGNGGSGLTDTQLRAAPLSTVGFAAIATGTFNRPANTTPYAAGNLVANSTTAGSVTPVALAAARTAAGSFLASRVRLRKNNASLTNASFRVYLFNASPTVTNGDGGALAAAGSASCIGWADITMAALGSGNTSPFSDGAFGMGDLNSLVALASGQTIWALIEARGAYTPASGETFALTLEVAQN